MYPSGLLSLPVMLGLTYWMSVASLLLRAPLKPLENEVPRNEMFMASEGRRTSAILEPPLKLVESGIIV